MLKNLSIALLVVLVALLGLRLWLKDGWSGKDNSTVSSTVVVQQVQKVMKLITVEGNYSEIMKYRDFDGIDFPGFRKDAVLRVNAKVSVGYNLEKMKISADDENKIIRIENMPPPEILSIDTDIAFENLSSGIFTGFSEEELTQLNAKAKASIRDKAMTNELIRDAEEQKKDMLELIFLVAKGSGYTIEVEGSPLLPNSPLNPNL